MTKFANAPEEGAQVSRLFAQMDKDKDGGIDIEEFMQFWKGVRAQNKSVESITEQLEKLLNKVEEHEKITRVSRASRMIDTADFNHLSRSSKAPRASLFVNLNGATLVRSGTITKEAEMKEERMRKEMEDII